MSLCRVFELPDGTIVAMHPNLKHKLDSETEAEFVDRICTEDAKKDPVASIATSYKDLDTSQLPNDRGRRHAWRMDKGAVVVDKTAPAPAHPKQVLFDQIDSAINLEELKTVLKANIMRGRL